MLATLTNFAVDGDFKNILLNIDFDKNGENNYRINLHTQIPYADEIKIVKKSDYNYYILLAETYAKPATTKINSELNSADIKLYPYAEQDLNNGYTKITLNTSKPIDFTISLQAQTASKFPIMDLVKIARLNQMFEQQKTTLKTQTLLAKKAPAPVVAKITPDYQIINPKPIAVQPKKVEPKKPVIVSATPKIATKAVSKPVVQKVAIKPQTTAAQKPAVKHTQTVAPIRIAKNVNSPITELKKQHKIAPKVAVKPSPQNIAKKPAVKQPAVKVTVAKQPAPAVKKPVGKAPSIKQPVVKQHIAKKPTAKQPAVQTSVAQKQIATQGTKATKQEILPQKTARTTGAPKTAEQQNKITEVETLASPEAIAATIKTKYEGMYKKYPILTIALISAIFAFIFGISQVITAKYRHRRYEEEIKKNHNKEEFEQILDENIYQAPKATPKKPTQRPNVAQTTQVKKTKIEKPTNNFAPVIENIQPEIETVFGEDVFTENYNISNEENIIEVDEQNEELIPENIFETLDFTTDTEETAQIEEPFEISNENTANDVATPAFSSNPIKNKEPEKPKEPVAEILSAAQVENDRGFYLADLNGAKSLVAYVLDKIFVIYSFKNTPLRSTQIDFRLSETNKQGDFYLVKVDNTKLLVKSEKEKISLVNVIQNAA